MRNLFFDLETTGLPQKGSNWESDFNSFPHIVEIGWQIYEDEKLVEQFARIIKPIGFEIPKEASDIHGIDNEMAINDGKDEKFILDIFMSSLKMCDKIIGHNTYFDTSITKASLLRLGVDKATVIKLLDKDKREDTCRMALKKFKGQPGNKMMKLTELYEKLFDEELKGAHQAMNDIKATAKCYFKCNHSA